MNFALSMLLAPLWVLAAFWWWSALRNPRKRSDRDIRRAMRAHDAMRKALR